MIRVVSMLGLVYTVGVAGFATLTLSVLLVAQGASASPDPFSAYADILPGQSTSAAIARGFLCQRDNRNYYTSDHQGGCALSLSQGPFSQIQLELARDVIVSTRFIAGSDSVQMGDVAAWLNALPSKKACTVLIHSSTRLPFAASATMPSRAYFQGLWQVEFIAPC